MVLPVGHKRQMDEAESHAHQLSTVTGAAWQFDGRVAGSPPSRGRRNFGLAGRTTFGRSTVRQSSVARNSRHASPVVPAEAGTQRLRSNAPLGPRLRGDDKAEGTPPPHEAPVHEAPSRWPPSFPRRREPSVVVARRSIRRRRLIVHNVQLRCSALESRRGAAAYRAGAALRHAAGRIDELAGYDGDVGR
jgi:hypothetical protein